MANEKQSELVRTIKTLDNMKVVVQEHETLNQIKGTIRFQNKPGYFEEKISNKVKYQNVSAVYNI